MSKTRSESDQTPRQTLEAMQVYEPEPYHSWLFNSPQASHRPAATQVALRDALSTLPPTRALITISEALAGTPHAYHGVSPEMMVHLGSWETDWGRSKSWVNPNFQGKMKYSDCVVECNCGATLAGLEENHARMEVDTDHAESCTQADKYRAKARLCEKRGDILREGMRLGQSGSQLTDRLGIRCQHIGHISSSTGVDTDAFHNEYRVRRLNTMVRLLKTHTTRMVAAIYGLTLQRVRSIIAGETPWSVGDFQMLRATRLAGEGSQ